MHPLDPVLAYSIYFNGESALCTVEIWVWLLLLLKMTPQPSQYILFAAEPYETISFKIPNIPIDKGEGKFFTHWNPDKQLFTLQLYFEAEETAGP